MGFMSQFGGIRKHQNNQACTKNTRVFKVLKLDSIQQQQQQKKKKKKKKKKKTTMTTTTGRRT